MVKPSQVPELVNEGVIKLIVGNLPVGLIAVNPRAVEHCLCCEDMAGTIDCARASEADDAVVKSELSEQRAIAVENNWCLRAIYAGAVHREELHQRIHGTTLVGTCGLNRSGVLEAYARGGHVFPDRKQFLHSRECLSVVQFSQGAGTRSSIGNRRRQ